MNSDSNGSFVEVSSLVVLGTVSWCCGVDVLN